MFKRGGSLLHVLLLAVWIQNQKKKWIRRRFQKILSQNRLDVGFRKLSLRILCGWQVVHEGWGGMGARGAEAWCLRKLDWTE